MRSAFSSPARSLIKTMVMTTGELDFDGIFFNSQEDADEGNNLFYPQIAYFLWIVFIILMPIILSNLLVRQYRMLCVVICLYICLKICILKRKVVLMEMVAKTWLL